MDRQSVYSTHVFEPNYEQGEDTNLQLLAQLEEFILGFRLDNKFVYRYGGLVHSVGTAGQDTYPWD